MKNEEDVQTAVDGVTFQQVLDSYGDARATEATQTAVQNYEKKHNLKDGKKVEPADPEPNPDDDKVDDETPAWAKALMEQNKALTERLNNMDAARTAKSRKQQLDKVLEKLPENLRKGYSRTSFEKLSDEEFKTLLEEVTTEVDGLSTELSQKGLVFGTPSSGGTKIVSGDISEEKANAIADALHI